MGAPLLLALMLLAIVVGPRTGLAQEEIDKSKAATFDKRLFAGTLQPKMTYACFVRVYDAEHLTKHQPVVGFDFRGRRGVRGLACESRDRQGRRGAHCRVAIAGVPLSAALSASIALS